MRTLPDPEAQALVAEAIRPASASLAAQQRAFDTFRTTDNEERPHRALGGQPPASSYVSSPRPNPAQLPRLKHPGYFLVKRVMNDGTFRCEDRLMFIANALKRRNIALDEIDTGI